MDKQIYEIFTNIKVYTEELGDKVEFFIDNQKVGQASTATYKSHNDLIHNFEVIQSRRNLGYGKAIFQWMLDSYPIQWLNVAKDNVVAQNLYKKFGFVIIGNVNVDGKIVYQMRLQDNKHEEIEAMKKIMCSAKETPCSNCPFRFNGKCAAEINATALYNAGYGDVKSYQEEIEQLRGQIKRLKEELPKLFRHFTEGDPYFDDYNFEIELQSYQKNDKNESVTSICLDTEDFEVITKDFIEAILNGTPSEDLRKVFEI